MITMPVSSWAAMKALLTAKTIKLQFYETADTYELFALEEIFVWAMGMRKDGGADHLDFDANYKATANAPLLHVDVDMRTVVTPSAFSVNADYKVRAKGYAGTAVAGATTNIDCAIGAEDRYLNGLNLILKDHVFGDTVTLQIVDVNNVLGYGAGAMLNQFGESWNVYEGAQAQGLVSFPYNARIYAGLYMRVVYVSTGVANVGVRVNFLLHKKVS